MPLVKLRLWVDPAEIPEDEIPILQGQGLVEYVVGGEGDPSVNGKNAPRGASVPKEK